MGEALRWAIERFLDIQDQPPFLSTQRIARRYPAPGMSHTAPRKTVGLGNPRRQTQSQRQRKTRRTPARPLVFGSPQSVTLTHRRAGRRFGLTHEPLCHPRLPKSDDVVSRVGRVAQPRSISGVIIPRRAHLLAPAVHKTICTKNKYITSKQMAVPNAARGEIVPSLSRPIAESCHAQHFANECGNSKRVLGPVGSCNPDAWESQDTVGPKD